MSQTTMIQPGALGFDSLNDPAPPAQLAADGISFRTIYMAQRSAYPGKITDADKAAGYEKQRILDHVNAGVGVLLNFESSADRWTGGAGAGGIDGAWSRRVCEALDYPDGLPVLISYDTDISAVTLPTAIAYGVAFNDALGGRWPIGVYGEHSIMKALDDLGVCELCWHVMAHFWDGAPAGRAVVHVEQRRPTPAETARMPYFTKTALDANDAVRPFAVWLPHADPPPPPPPPPDGEDDMAGIASVTWQGQQHIFMRAADGSLGHYFWDGAAWQYQNHGGILTSSPSAVVSPDGNRVDVFGRGADDAIWQNTYAAGAADWDGWHKIADWP
jgi:hypothetical protein